jgi:hypothetical protein
MSYEPVKESTKEEYLKIWTHYAVGHFSKEQLSKLFGCTPETITNAIEWCADNRLQFKAGVLAEAAKEAVEARVRELKNDLVRIKQSSNINWNWVIGINRLVQENEELLWKLQMVLQDKSLVTINTTQVSQIIKAREELEGLDDAERREVISRIREVIDKPSNG